MVIRTETAEAEDAKALAEVSRRAFNNDIHYGAPGAGGPPGYDSEEWQHQAMRFTHYYKIVADGRIIGGFFVYDKGPGHRELVRIFLAPEVQNQGLGARAMQLMEQAFPDTRTWSLDTPLWNQRTQHFYEKMGYIRIGVNDEGLVLYEKTMPQPASGA